MNTDPQKLRWTGPQIHVQIKLSDFRVIGRFLYPPAATAIANALYESLAAPLAEDGILAPAQRIDPLIYGEFALLVLLVTDWKRAGAAVREGISKMQLEPFARVSAFHAGEMVFIALHPEGSPAFNVFSTLKALLDEQAQAEARMGINGGAAGMSGQINYALRMLNIGQPPNHNP